jgi:hypothetical protein
MIELLQLILILGSPVVVYIFVYVSGKAWYTAKHQAFENYTKRAQARRRR